MNVLVTGATGFVGRQVVKELHAAGHRVRTLVRRPTSPEARLLAEQYDAELRGADVLNAGSLAPAMLEVEAVIHLVGIISELGTQTFERVHTVATSNVVEAAKAASVGRFVHMSALGTRAGAPARYHQTKWAAEQIVHRSDLAWTIFRPSIVYGPGDGFVGLFARLSRWSPVVPLIGSGRTRFQPIPVEDVARAFVKALAEPRAAGRTFDLCGPETLTLGEIVDAVLAATRRRRLKLPLPLAVARGQAVLLEWVWPRLFRQSPPFNRDQLLMLQEDNVGQGGPAAELFGLSRVPFRERLAAYLRP